MSADVVEAVFNRWMLRLSSRNPWMVFAPTPGGGVEELVADCLLIALSWCGVLWVVLSGHMEVARASPLVASGLRRIWPAACLAPAVVAAVAGATSPAMLPALLGACLSLRLRFSRNQTPPPPHPLSRIAFLYSVAAAWLHNPALQALPVLFAFLFVLGFAAALWGGRTCGEQGRWPVDLRLYCWGKEKAAAREAGATTDAPSSPPLPVPDVGRSFVGCGDRPGAVNIAFGMRLPKTVELLCCASCLPFLVLSGLAEIARWEEQQQQQQRDRFEVPLGILQRFGRYRTLPDTGPVFTWTDGAAAVVFFVWAAYFTFRSIRLVVCAAGNVCEAEVEVLRLAAPHPPSGFPTCVTVHVPLHTRLLGLRFSSLHTRPVALRSVTIGSPADKAGLRLYSGRGITCVDGTPVSSLRQITTHIRSRLAASQDKEDDDEAAVDIVLDFEPVRPEYERRGASPSMFGRFLYPAGCTNLYDTGSTLDNLRDAFS